MPPPAPPLPPPAPPLPPKSLVRPPLAKPSPPKPAPVPAPMVMDYPPVAFHFTVYFDSKMRDADCSFRAVSGIGTELETETVVEGGENRYVLQLPKAAKSQHLVLERGIAPMGSRMVQWCSRVLEGDRVQPIVPTTVWVQLLDENADPLRMWSFANAYPVKWQVEAFQSSKNEVAIEKIELAYLFSKREV